MHKFALANASGSSCDEVLHSCLSQLDQLQGSPNLGFIYVTDECAADLPRMLDAVRAHTGVRHWVGSVGMGICCTNHEYYDQPAAAIMLGEFAPGSFRIIGDATHEVQQNRGSEALQVAVVHGDPRNQDLPGLIRRLPRTLGNGYLVGGLTSSRSHYYQVADEPTEGRLSGVIFEPEQSIVTGLSQGCSPIGRIHELSECSSNIAVRIDERPALDVFLEDIGEVLARDLERVAGYIFVGLPVPGTDTGDYLVRNLVGIDMQQRLLAVGDHLKTGASIMFCRRDGQSALEDLERMLDSVKRRAATPVRGALYFSCLGRGRSLFGSESQELKLVSAALGEAPLVGFYANGEISGDRLYGYTGVLTLFL